MDNPLISILMPVKNTSHFLSECIDSILNQTISSWELITVDDHSTDNSKNLLLSYSNKDSRIKVYDNKGIGIIEALRTAFKMCRGTLVTRMDSDDVMTSNKLERLSNKLLDKGLGYVAVGLVKYISEYPIGEGYKKYENWLNELTINGSNFNDLYKECVIPSPCWMVYQEDLKKCGDFTPHIYPEDYDLVFRFYKYGLKCIPFKEVVHYWRDYTERTSRNDPNYAFNSFIDLKVHYFLSLHKNSSKELIVWGAGVKGKRIVKLLREKNVSFYWVCDNPKKIGKEIYGKKLLPFSKIETIKNSQSIIAVANPSSQQEIRNFFETRNKKVMEDYFFFC